MQPEGKDRAYLWDMLDAACAITDFVREKKIEDYIADRMLRGAVERHLEIIGEAARRVSPAFSTAHPEVPWRLMIAQRNVLAHEYGEIRHERIWIVCTQHIPELIQLIEGFGIAR